MVRSEAVRLRPGARIIGVFRLLLLCGLVLAACRDGGAPAQRLRLINDSPYPLAGVTIIFPEEEIYFGDLPAGATSDYRIITRGVYRYSAFEMEVEGESIRQPVIDWMGEQPMDGRDFTYVLEVDPDAAYGWVSLTVRKD